MLAALNKINNPVKKIVLNRRKMNKAESLAYTGAFLTMARERLIEKVKLNQLSQDTINEVYLQIYEEANLLYTDEHWETSNADFLEQSYSK